MINQKETLLAREKQERIKEQWARWIWQDADRTEQLCKIYNELFNSSRRRDFDGAHLTLPGINTSILRDGDLARHQKDAVWMGLQVPSVLLDLCVGAGKTFIGIVWAHELKRLGLPKKVLITVPNHPVEHWAAEVNSLYPDMRVLAMSADDFSKERRGTIPQPHRDRGVGCDHLRPHLVRLHRGRQHRAGVHLARGREPPILSDRDEEEVREKSRR